MLQSKSVAGVSCRHMFCVDYFQPNHFGPQMSEQECRAYCLFVKILWTELKKEGLKLAWDRVLIYILQEST